MEAGPVAVKIDACHHALMATATIPRFGYGFPAYLEMALHQWRGDRMMYKAPELFGAQGFLAHVPYGNPARRP